MGFEEPQSSLFAAVFWIKIRLFETQGPSVLHRLKPATRSLPLHVGFAFQSWAQLLHNRSVRPVPLRKHLLKKGFADQGTAMSLIRF
jgi:hypothetical protein